MSRDVLSPALPAAAGSDAAFTGGVRPQRAGASGLRQAPLVADRPATGCG
jgi:hypothetical protein